MDSIGKMHLFTLIHALHSMYFLKDADFCEVLDALRHNCLAAGYLCTDWLQTDDVDAVS